MHITFMQDEFSERKSAVALGVVFVIVDILWAFAIVFGGQKFIDWLFALSLLSAQGVAPAFDFIYFVASIPVCFICGAIFGWLFAFVWNKLK